MLLLIIIAYTTNFFAAIACLRDYKKTHSKISLSLVVANLLAIAWSTWLVASMT